MIKIGRTQSLKIANFASNGAYLDGGTGNSKDNILLPKKLVPEGAKEGDELRVFIYKDSEDRTIATTKQPLVEVGQLGHLKVVQKTKIGAFLDWGLEKDLFLPFSAQKYKVEVGKSYLVSVYVDKTGRLAATTDIVEHLKTHGPYKKSDRVSGVVYFVKKGVGAFVAVDNKYMALVPQSEYFHSINIGDKIDARVIRVTSDGKLDLSPRKVAYKQMDRDAEMILEVMKSNKGYISLNDNSDPMDIKRRLNMSKSAFKRAVGRLLREDRIIQTKNGLRFKEGQ